MWDREKFVFCLDWIIRDGHLGDTKVKTKTALYDYLAQKIHISAEAVRSWTKAGSSGPGDEELREKLEGAMGLETGALYTGNLTQATDFGEDAAISDFSKKNILECYFFMKNYLHDDKVDTEQCFRQMTFEIKKRKIAIPAGIYEKIERFVADNLNPIVEAPLEVFAACYADELWEEGEDGVFQLKSDAAAELYRMNFRAKLYDIEKELDNFGMQELSKYLI